MHRKHRSSVLAAGALVIILALAAAAGAAATGGRSGGSAAAQVRAAERTLLKALVDADTVAAGRLLAHDFQLIDVLGEPETRSDYLATLGGGIDYVAVKPVSPIRVRLSRNIAVTRFEAAFVVTAGPDRLKHRGWITSILERRNGRWQFVWSQTTPVPNDQALLVRALKAA
ncbi:MAG TPA: nuclear transport factor 2 family protein [Gaiella sp.]|nr:nuclear transport factor 2 family protein [Gaiella sp.]